MIPLDSSVRLDACMEERKIVQADRLVLYIFFSTAFKQYRLTPRSNARFSLAFTKINFVNSLFHIPDNPSIYEVLIS